MVQDSSPEEKLIKKPLSGREIIQPGGAQFLLSAPHFRDLPQPAGVEIGVMGRSNVGKSSFINHALENKNLARVSKKPGKTNCANLFKINHTMIWVDLPGYGYAKVSHSEKDRWSRLIRDYCMHRENLQGVIWLVDIRHVGVRADVEAFTWLGSLGLPLFLVLTKGDKLTQRESAKQQKKAETMFPCDSQPTIYSTQKHNSRQKFWNRFQAWLGISEQDGI